MATYLYCLLPAASDPPPADLVGIVGERVRRLVAGGIAAWVGTVESPVVSRSLETAKQHDAVVRAAMRTGATALPARGGQRFDDDVQCVAEIERRERAIAGTLVRVADCVEMTLHLDPPPASETRTVTRPAAEPAPPKSVAGRGRAYLDALRARRDVEHNVQAELADIRSLISSAVGDLVRAQSPSAGDVSGAATVFHLVPRAQVPRYREAVASLAARHALGIRVGGPYAPYTFSEIRE